MEEGKSLNNPGPIIFFGSGETLPASGKAYEFLARKIGQQPRISILETPAGFQPNSPEVAGEIADFLKKRLQNFTPQTHIIPARKKGTRFSPENPEILSPILQSNWIMMGPGSPTYAVNQLENSLAYAYLVSMHRLGAALSLASAAVLALSAFTLPVYEIYKVGMDLHWQKGLNFFSNFGLDLIFIPHWNNQDGGDKLDTSRCYMGTNRFKKLHDQLPSDITILGIDEQTAFCFDFKQPCICEVFGKGGITIIKEGEEQVIKSGGAISLSDFGDFHIPDSQDLIDPKISALIDAARVKDVLEPPPQVLSLLLERKTARAEKDWSISDKLRKEILKYGWSVKDTDAGQVLERSTGDSS